MSVAHKRVSSEKSVVLDEPFTGSPSKRSRGASPLESFLDGIECVVLDVEGTTTPLSFVKETLFPYARNNVDAYLRETFSTPQTQADMQHIVQQSIHDCETNSDALHHDAPLVSLDGSQEEVVSSVSRWVKYCMEKDRKIGALKALQGHIWVRGYESGAFSGFVFPDVRPAMQRFKAQGRSVYIYSSGSVQAQQLLFRYSSAGDLREFIGGYFDTSIGDKKEAASYVRIAKDIHAHPSTILFVSDNVDELRAASQAGFAVLLAVRPGNTEVAEDCEFLARVVTSFSFL